MPLSVSINPAAKAELSQHVLYLHIHATPRTAERFVEAVYKSFEQLVDMPDLGAELPVRRALLTGIRCWPVKKPFRKYVIYYRMDGSTIEIVHLLHGARDSDTILGT
jgi:toxin ParE1/3/4